MALVLSLLILSGRSPAAGVKQQQSRVDSRKPRASCTFVPSCIQFINGAQIECKKTYLSEIILEALVKHYVLANSLINVIDHLPQMQSISQDMVDV